MRATLERVRTERQTEPAASAAPGSSRARELAIRALPPVAAVVLCCAFLPALPIFLGVFLLVAVGLHLWVPDLRRFIEPFLRLPIERVATVRQGLMLTARVGLVLLLGGSLGAAIGGHLRSEREYRARERAAAEERRGEVLERAEAQLAAGDVSAAELTLLELDEQVAWAGVDREEADRLRERVLRSGDPDVILGILKGLEPRELQALEEGRSVPAALDFGHPALNKRALQLALVLLDEAREQRAHR